MNEPIGVPASPLEDQLDAARQFHAEAFADYLECPSRPSRLVLVDALESHELALAAFHGVSIGELSVLPEEQAAYTDQFMVSSAEKDDRDTSVGLKVARAIALAGATGYFTDKISRGDLYFHKEDLVAVVVGTVALLAEVQASDDGPKSGASWVIEDPFGLSREVLASAGQTGIGFVKDENGKIHLVDTNLRRQVRRQLLSRRRRAISTFAGQL